MIKAYVTERFAGFGVDVSLVMHPAEGSLDAKPRILRLPTSENSFPDWEEFDPYGPMGEPTMRLGWEEARAVLDALTHHFQGAEDTRALRRDYDYERKRVDTLIEHLATIAKQPAEPQSAT